MPTEPLAVNARISRRFAIQEEWRWAKRAAHIMPPSPLAR
jgi:hypothetical protein